MQLTVQGVVERVATQRRLFSKRHFLMVRMTPADIRRIEQEVNTRFPGYGSLGTKGSAIPFEQIEDPSRYPTGQRVEMRVAIGSLVEEYFLGASPLAVESVQPLQAAS